MSHTINFGIDLGTTNSVIARAKEGKVEVFRNPVGHKETLPSVVAFRKDRIIVGDKAREYMEKDPGNVVGLFKRKMGTSVKYRIASTGQFLSPPELSSMVMRELKNFIHSGEQVEAAVITIPASFDTIQSNATKEAGYMAGFRQVELLQEPIAASLAYVNQEGNPDLKGQWLVYDLGGGTLDIALVKVHEGEMRVVDHEGNNFLGGTDFDALVVDKIVIPHLYDTGKFSDLERQFKSASGKYNKLYYALLNKAEEAKVILSSSLIADIEFEIQDDDGLDHEIYLQIHRFRFEELIDPIIDQTIGLIRSILDRMGISPSEIAFVLMVGGSTFIPRVRQKIGDELGIKINCEVDPTNAVAVGAAYYAGTRLLKTEKNAGPAGQKPETRNQLSVKMAYSKTSQDENEYFSARVEGNMDGLFYRIRREDGGFDSGLKQLQIRIEEDLPLVPNMFNAFRIAIYDGKGNVVSGDLETIGITQGKFSVTGQPLPNDICIEVDDPEERTTKLEAIFKKNEILPLRRTFTKVVMKTIRKGEDSRIIINVLEGPEYALPSTNQPIGFISVSGKALERDLVKGSDVEITLEISESRDLKISAYLLMTDQEFVNIFTASERHVDLTRLLEEAEVLVHEADEQIRELESRDEFEEAIRMVNLKDDLEDIVEKARFMSDDDVTDLKFQLEDRKRKAALQIENLTRDNRVTRTKTEYFEAKQDCRIMVDDYGTDAEKQSLETIISQEKEILRSDNVPRINDFIKRIERLAWTIKWRLPDFLTWVFYYVEARQDAFSDPGQGQRLLDSGRGAIENKEFEKLRVVNNQLLSLLPKEKKEGFMRGTGIG